MKRRQFITGLGAVLAGASFGAPAMASAFKPHGGVTVMVDPPRGGSGRSIPRRFRKQVVDYDTRERPGTIVVDPANHYLNLVQDEGKALRYGVGVGREGFGWSGRARIRRKAEWPTWTPPETMIRRRPELAKWRGGMPGGPQNPLGARALYLYQGNRDTLYRIHGTNEPWTIGQSMSSGCIRMVNKDVEDLYTRVRLGARVVVLRA